VPFTTFDVWDQALLTDIIRRPPLGRDPGAAEDTTPVLGEQIAPMKTHAGRTAKVRVQEVKPFGVGQYRAPDATPPLYKPAVTWTDTIVELLLIDEMERISEEDWLKLNSSDEMNRRSAGASLVDRGRILKLRNDRKTEQLRWDMLTTGTTTVEYPSGSSFVIDFGFATGHKPTASVLWSDLVNADPVGDIQSWSELLAADSGFYARHVIMNSKTYNYLVYNSNIKAGVNFYASGANSINRPRKQEILNLFTTFAQDVDLIVYDNGYRVEGETGIGTSSLTKYLPDGKVLVTTDFTIDGTNIADTLDGQVTVSSGYNSVDIRQGWQAEVMLDHISKTHFFRSASARIPRLLVPEAIICATVA
jgi:hypothetical protein